MTYSTAFSDTDIDRILEMAWEDRTPFEAIKEQYGLNESSLIRLMRQQMRTASFRMWRKRMAGRITKHRGKRGFVVGRFVCPSQARR